MAKKTNIDFPEEHPCFDIQRVVLHKDDKIPHWLLLHQLTGQAQGRCLGIEGVKILATTIQNRLIEHDYITTKVMIPQQNLMQGTLTPDIQSGTIGKVTLTDDSDKFVNLHTTFPGSKGDLLDLRAIEQGLENMQRIPDVTANIALHPGVNAGESDLEITRKQPSYWRLGGWLDDSGSKQTGRYQSGLALYIDNPTSMNDLFYVSAGRDLQFQSTRHSNNGSLYYSVPYGFWSLDLYASRSEYLQNINGIYADFAYRGKYRNLSYQSRFRQQYSPDRLTTQDQFSIGNRWTVRGFDGEVNMMANKGYYLRNDLNLNLPKLGQQLYLGMDYGKVKGDGSNDFADGHLLGSVAGIRGRVKAIGCDAFVGVPLSKPDNFTTSPVNLGFTLQWQF